MSIIKPIPVGSVFGSLVVISDLPIKNRRHPVLCRCVCGTEKIFDAQNLKLGKTESCGCQRKTRLRHGEATAHRRTTEYRIWEAMRYRCGNPRSRAYKWYGARGIKVCSRWACFENFLADMGRRPAGRSLDRINNDGNYEPGNCRWATALEQVHNRRPLSKMKRVALNHL
jgi:hypothetical protein